MDWVMLKEAVRRPYVVVDTKPAMVRVVMQFKPTRQDRMGMDDLKAAFAQMKKLGDKITQVLQAANLKPYDHPPVLDPRGPTSIDVTIEPRMVNEYDTPIQAVYDALKNAGIKFSAPRRV